MSAQKKTSRAHASQPHPWPVFKAHAEASCFNCGGDFGPGYPLKSGSAPGDGEHYQACERCEMLTFYDLETNAEGTR